ncbi:hypothetical protein INS49_013073 [Diaporthe citri]|uniref:uncharacterized protein n=1 Tax=Diaporthe citri TaxID=83186 RepID=UPI001C7E9D6D|nr:uncharacterized protein INS49_013073 [Diaporthe citri]KAG6359552.1 hypothetical protein INS49_013073 [Diaporthe citri]
MAIMSRLPGPIFVDTSYGRLAVRSEGSGSLPPVLCIHGNSSSSDIFRHTMPGYAKAAVEVLEKLEIKEVVVVGWSLGGHIGTEMLPLFPGTKGLMMIGSMLVGLWDKPLDDNRTRWHMREDLTDEDLTMSAKVGTGGPFEQWMADAAAVEIVGGQHGPMWEKPDDFLPALERFLADVSA